jgi:hypothetical protein
MRKSSGAFHQIASPPATFPVFASLRIVDSEQLTRVWPEWYTACICNSHDNADRVRDRKRAANAIRRQ